MSKTLCQKVSEDLFFNIREYNSEEKLPWISLQYALKDYFSRSPYRACTKPGSIMNASSSAASRLSFKTSETEKSYVVFASNVSELGKPRFEEFKKSIEMLVVYKVDPTRPYFTNPLGIVRSPFYAGEKHPKISVALHSFAAKSLKSIYPTIKHVFVKPDHQMTSIFFETFAAKNALDAIFIGGNLNKYPPKKDDGEIFEKLKKLSPASDNPANRIGPVIFLKQRELLETEGKHCPISITKKDGSEISDEDNLQELLKARNFQLIISDRDGKQLLVIDPKTFERGLSKDESGVKLEEGELGWLNSSDRLCYYSLGVNLTEEVLTRFMAVQLTIDADRLATLYDYEDSSSLSAGDVGGAAGGGGSADHGEIMGAVDYDS
jgi:hypothetical protein